MQRCEFCGSPVPASANFCGICGRIISDWTWRANEFTGPLQQNQLNFDPPPLLNSPSPDEPNVQTEQKDGEGTIRSRWPEVGPSQNVWLSPGQQSLESYPALPDFMLPGNLI